MSDRPEEAKPSQDTTRDWAAEEAEAKRIEAAREEALRQQQRERE